MDENLVTVDKLVFQLVPFEREDARMAGEIRALLRRSGASIGPYDILIAGQALARGLVLVTHNVQEFGRVPGLRVEDWQE
jgi:tRNA(fMet)-specific endonuclease VapC